MRASLLPVLAIVILAVVGSSGCGRGDDDVVVVESPDTDFSASPGQVIITASRTPKPSPVPTPSVIKASAADPNAPVPFLLVLPPQLKSLTGPLSPRVRVELTAGATKIVDLASADGLGAEGKFKAVKPGKYLLRLTGENWPDITLLERPVTVDGERQESVTFAAVSFRIPVERSHEVAPAIQITLTAEPSKKPVLKATLDKFETKGVVGESHPQTLLLPFGKYRYSLADLSKDPTIGFVGLPEGTVPQLAADTFELTEEHPSMVVELASVIRTK